MYDNFHCFSSQAIKKNKWNVKSISRASVETNEKCVWCHFFCFLSSCFSHTMRQQKLECPKYVQHNFRIDLLCKMTWLWLIVRLPLFSVLFFFFLSLCNGAQSSKNFHFFYYAFWPSQKLKRKKAENISICNESIGGGRPERKVTVFLPDILATHV